MKARVGGQNSHFENFTKMCVFQCHFSHLFKMFCDLWLNFETLCIIYHQFLTNLRKYCDAWWHILILDEKKQLEWASGISLNQWEAHGPIFSIDDLSFSEQGEEHPQGCHASQCLFVLRFTVWTPKVLTSQANPQQVTFWQNRVGTVQSTMRINAVHSCCLAIFATLFDDMGFVKLGFCLLPGLWLVPIG